MMDGCGNFPTFTVLDSVPLLDGVLYIPSSG